METQNVAKKTVSDDTSNYSTNAIRNQSKVVSNDTNLVLLTPQPQHLFRKIFS